MNKLFGKKRKKKYGTMSAAVHFDDGTSAEMKPVDVHKPYRLGLDQGITFEYKAKRTVQVQYYTFTDLKGNMCTRRERYNTILMSGDTLHMTFGTDDGWDYAC